ncbi:SDR family oxidoreductase [Enteractinococcus fodinae]|uniref:Uncharacterized protein YbjT (DUF2867 family) n=1 Tax=Enteractinococcus fodinae TaxID=684663 RepID=A0ABU2AZ21_9MICC|nr:SDR family oxidoreductase [Enteractinococcus fodinae]MDR7346592.1 uncharacterized protein YbjT (DUF2867 family) [Enteractinococcus fodinae]
MKIVVLGATGTIGAKITEHLQTTGHEVVQASRSRGVDAATGEGLHDAFTGANAVIDCLNIETLSEKKAVRFFSKTSHNVVRVARRTGLTHVLCVGIAGAADPKVNAANGYYKGKAVQEKIYQASGLPVTVIHSTQWFELIDNLVRRASVGPVTLLPTMRMAPVAADSVARLVADCAVADPPSGVQRVAIRGPEITTGVDMAQAILAAHGRVGGRRPRILKQVPFLGKATATGGLIPQDTIVDDITLEAWLGMASSPT